MRKKTLTLMLVLAMGMALAACGDSKEETKAAETVEETELSTVEGNETENVQETEGTETAQETSEAVEASADGLISKELPKVTGTIREHLTLTLVGVENATYFGDPALRIWFEATNCGKYMVEPRDTEGYQIFGYQNGNELKTCLSDNRPMQEEYWVSDFYPGTTTMVCITYQLENETDPLSLQIDWDEGSMTYDFDVVNVAGAPDEISELTPVTDTAWFTPDADTYTVFDVDYSVIGAEVIDGYALNDNSSCSIVRVTYEATSNSNKDSYIGTPFTPVQDGIELLSAFPAEAADTDLSGAVTITPGETVQYTVTYSLNSMDPIFFVELDASGLRGSVVTLE